MKLEEKNKYNWFGEIFLLSVAGFFLYNGVQAITSIGWHSFFGSIIVFGVIMWSALFIFRELYLIFNKKYEYLDFTDEYIKWNYGFFLDKEKKLDIYKIKSINIDNSSIRLQITMKTGKTYYSSILALNRGPNFFSNGWDLEIKLKKLYPNIKITASDDSN